MTTNIGTMTIAEAGWKRLDAQTMRWIGPPLPAVGGRDMLQLKGRGMDLAVATAYLEPGADPDDEEAVAEALEDGWAATLPLAALVVLRHGIHMAITAMEAAQGVTIEYGGEDTQAAAVGTAAP